MTPPMLRKSLGLSVIILLTVSFSSCASAQDYSAYDLSTVEGVNAAREAKLGRPLDSHSKNCVSLPERLPGIILLGGFAHDRGCRLQEAIINKQGVSMGREFSTTALESLGWKGAGEEKRKELALNWVQDGLLAFETPLTQATEDFKAETFQKPQAISHGDGSVTVSLWVKKPSGMNCESAYDKFKFTFLKDGTLDGKTSENSFSIPCGSTG